jgi:drug/metabolite transporter (DMT)-like permease
MLVYLKLLCTAMFWGGTFVAGRMVGQWLDPFSAAFVRFFIAFVCLYALARRYEGGLPRLTRGQILPVLILGASGVFAYNALFFAGLKTVVAGRAAVIVATNPIFIALLAALIFREPLTRVKGAGVLLSVTGAVLVISHGRPDLLLSQGLSVGDVAILGCVAAWVTYSLVGKAAMGMLSPLAAVTWSCLVGMCLLLPFAWAEGLWGALAAMPLAGWGCLFYLSVCGTVLGFTWYYQGVKTIGPGRASVFINFVPISAILAGWAILGEPADATLLLGGVLVPLGVYLTNRPACGNKRPAAAGFSRLARPKA